MAIFPSQGVLKELRLFPLVIELLDVRVFVAMPVPQYYQRRVSALGNKLTSGREVKIELIALPQTVRL